ncbi:hypothetical protein PTSG_06221 [Salpingoeca rosetta]|uniref:Ribokinase n=1 Tax=Salpingoeca rosetta (strain ATCC 50818 / BSB-021) TaxID=946362 RepID=F2UCA3_SALR5|nr:uncharacterized protein PTSG_06221 [Salpingoeca rosetta]EGD74210.1 hypothetical protein PTSG_06221 [Salpingoeca rosetta]|eukprot:XP_004993110.1 hypothetical protein PTSG_06221 [Salpingoeca rosetta]
MSSQVVVVGASNMDLTSYVPSLPKPGETLHGHCFKKGFGGKGANQCVMAAKLGASTAMVTKVGKDVFGKETKDNYERYGINTEHVLEDDAEFTGVAPIAVDDAGQNSIIIVNGANDKLSEADIGRVEDLIAHAKVVITQYEIRPETTLAALRLANKHGVFSIFNLAPAKAEIASELFTLPDIFCVNETEAAMVTGVDVQTVQDAEAAARALQDKHNAKCIIITLGPQGTYVLPKPGDGDPFHMPATKVTAVDTSGAGDAFIGALGYFLATDPSLPLRTAVAKAGAIATVSVQQQGTQSSYPDASVLASLHTE